MHWYRLSSDPWLGGKTEHTGVTARVTRTMYNALTTFLTSHYTMCVCVCVCVCIYRVSQEECARLREGIPYVKV